MQTPAPTPLPGSTPLPVSTPLPGSADGSMYNIPTGSSDYSTPVSDSGGNTDVKGGRPSPYMVRNTLLLLLSFGKHCVTVVIFYLPVVDLLVIYIFFLTAISFSLAKSEDPTKR